jgi:hypothetical protein
MRIYETYIVVIGTGQNRFFFGSVFIGFCRFFYFEKQELQLAVLKTGFSPVFFRFFLVAATGLQNTSGSLFGYQRSLSGQKRLL